MTPRPRILVIAGPTATGKSEAAVAAAEWLRAAGRDAEILSADSMQVYRGMDIGTAKTSPELRARVPHHLIDIADPTEHFDVMQYREAALPILVDLSSRGAVPVIAGGTGFYIRGLLDGIFTAPPAPRAVRERLEAEAAHLGPDALHARLRAVDPASAARLHPNDVRRVVRALEVHEATGTPLSEWHRQHEKDPWGGETLYLCLIRDLDDLDRRIALRVDAMFREGLVEEVQRLIARGCGRQHTSMQAIGYKEVLEALLGTLSMDEAKDRILLETRRFARRQLTWFRGDRRYRMTEAGDAAALLERLAVLV